MDAICRTCLRASNNNMSFLFENAILLHKVYAISSVEIMEDEDLPKNVCAECIVNINLSYNFRRVIIKSDLELRERRNFLREKHKISENSNDESDLLSYIDETDTTKFEIINCDESIKQEDLVDEDGLTKQESDDVTINIQNELLDTSKALEEFKSLLDSVKEKKKKEKLYKCTKCDFQTTVYKKYSNHAQSHEVKLCTMCGKLIRAANMPKHIAAHTGPPVACEYCGKLCKHEASLKGHMLIHKGINRKCRTCGEWFKERASYYAHVKTHTAKEDKSVTCPICDKRVYDKKVLKKHLRSHTGERPYLCVFCNKGFSSNDALKTHRRQHTNEKPYKCALCPMTFRQRVSLRTHLKSKHQRETDR